MAARDNPALYRAFGRNLQDNTMGYLAPGDGIRDNIRDYFNAYQGVSGLAPEEQAAAQNALGASQFTDANGWTYIAQPYANGTAGRNLYYAYKPGEIERARATGQRAKAGAFDADTGEFLYEQEMTSKADSARGLKLGLAAVGGLFGASQLGLLGPGVQGAGNIGATGAMEGVVGPGGMNVPAATGIPGNPFYTPGAESGVPGNPFLDGSAPLSEAGIPANPFAEGGVPGNPFLDAAKVTAPGLLEGASKWLGPAATVLGGLAGAQGQEQSQTTSRDIPEWLKPYVLGSEGNPGLLGHTQGLLARQMSPGFLDQADHMRNLGMGLLNTPQRGNGFDLFTKGRY